MVLRRQLQNLAGQSQYIYILKSTSANEIKLKDIVSEKHTVSAVRQCSKLNWYI